MGSISKEVRIGANIRIYEEKPSGIQNFIRGLFSELIDNYPHYQFVFFSTGKKKIEEKARYITGESIVLSIIKAIHPLILNIFFDNIYILKLIYSQKLQIFIGSSYILPILKPKNVKYITVIYDLSYLTYKHSAYNPYLNLVMYMKFVIPFILKRADKVVVPSHFVMEQINKHYGTEYKKMAVIYGGRDDFFYKVKNKKNYDLLKKKYNVSQPYCFTNATNHERKNIFGLIEAFKNIKINQDMQLIITGLLPEETITEIKTYINKLGLNKNVKFLGFVTKEELRILYSYARIFIFPSFEEGFGFPVLEAAACGCLPICSNTGALPELIGNRKLVFNPRDVDSISRKIEEVLALSQVEYNSELAIVSKHIQKFAWKNTAREYDLLFQSMV